VRLDLPAAMPSSAPLLRSFFEGADSNRAARSSASAAPPADEAPKSTVTIVDGRLVVKSPGGTVLVRGEPSKVAKKPAPAAPFAISSLPQDVHERIAGMLFKEFSDSLSEALGQARHSREELENAAATADSAAATADSAAATADSAAGGSNEVDMSGVFSAIKSLSRWVSISSMYRATFRRFYVSAVFRAIVHEAMADTDADGVLMTSCSADAATVSSAAAPRSPICPRSCRSASRSGSPEGCRSCW
jgi:hypothetical protein